MIDYHKIQSVFLRDPATKHKTFLMGQWSLPEFGFLADLSWTWTEKIDGTNIRVHWDGSKRTIGGRTDAAQIPAFLLVVLDQLLPGSTLASVFGSEPTDVTLFGEGYGAKIQKGGGLYRPGGGQSFILFDVLIGGMYLERLNVEDVALKLGLDLVPQVGVGSLHDAIDKVRGGLRSMIADRDAEGLVMRPKVELRTRRGDRIITKVKAKDFQ